MAYPIPGNGMLNIKGETKGNDDLVLRLYNIAGLVYNDELKPGTGKWMQQVNLTNQLSPGMYTVQLISNNKTQTQKLIIE